MGCLGAIGLVLCARIAADARRPPALRAAAALCGPTLGLGVYLSFSRGALFALGAGLALLVVLAPDRPRPAARGGRAGGCRGAGLCRGQPAAERRVATARPDRRRRRRTADAGRTRAPLRRRGGPGSEGAGARGRSRAPPGAPAWGGAPPPWRCAALVRRRRGDRRPDRGQPLGPPWGHRDQRHALRLGRHHALRVLGRGPGRVHGEPPQGHGLRGLRGRVAPPARPRRAGRRRALAVPRDALGARARGRRLPAPISGRHPGLGRSAPPPGSRGRGRPRRGLSGLGRARRRWTGTGSCPRSPASRF